VYRDLDGKGGAFGGMSVLARTDDAAASSVYASLDTEQSPKVLTVIAINKTEQPLMAEVRLTGVRLQGKAEVHQLTVAAAEPRAAGQRAADTERLRPLLFLEGTPVLSVASISPLRLAPLRGG
jgi:hypothetical protein